MITASNVRNLFYLFIPVLFWGCGPSLVGVVVMPDGSKITNMSVMVYTDPLSDSVKVGADGTFKLGKNMIMTNSYTLIAEDGDGNLGFVRNFKPAENPDEKVVIKLSRELEAKDAVMEGDLYINPDSGPGEKIFKSSQ